MSSRFAKRSADSGRRITGAEHIDSDAKSLWREPCIDTLRYGAKVEIRPDEAVLEHLAHFCDFTGSTDITADGADSVNSQISRMPREVSALMSALPLIATVKADIAL